MLEKLPLVCKSMAQISVNKVSGNKESNDS